MSHNKPACYEVHTRTNVYGPFEKERNAENHVRMLKKYHKNGAAEVVAVY